MDIKNGLDTKALAALKIPKVHLGIGSIVEQINAQKSLLRKASLPHINIISDYQKRMDASLRAFHIATENPLGRHFEQINQAVLNLQKHQGITDRVASDFREQEKIFEKVQKQFKLRERVFEKVNEQMRFQREVFARLDEKLNFLGAFDLEEYDDEAVEEEIKSNVDEDIKSTLIKVDWFPIRMVRRIFDNPSVMREIDPRNFEEFTAYMVDSLGFEDVTLTPPSNDGGRDVIARKNFGDIPIIYSFECKQYKKTNKIGVDIIRSLLGSVAHKDTQANIGVLVTTSTFTEGARNFILNDARVDGKDYADINKWIQSLRA